MSEERKRSIAPWIASIGLALVLYVLSIGPAWATIRHAQNQTAARCAFTVYAPLFWLTEESELAYDLFGEYVGFWYEALYGNDPR